MSRRLTRLLPALLAIAALSCDADFQPDPPVGPAAVPIGRFTDVRIEYRQPNGCSNAAERCEDLVVFFGSWMKAGEEVYLEPIPASQQWSGVALHVPVNWPPNDEPHLVRVFDPHLVATPNGGVTAARLTIGGQMISQYDSPGTPSESGLIYVDDNGVGRNPQ